MALMDNKMDDNFDYAKIEIDNFKEAKNFSIIIFTIIKTVIASLIIYFSEFGIYVVLGYIFYSVERSNFYRVLNTDETNFTFQKLTNKINHLEKKLENQENGL